jgi:hypothetical protein
VRERELDRVQSCRWKGERHHHPVLGSEERPVTWARPPFLPPVLRSFPVHAPGPLRRHGTVGDATTRARASTRTDPSGGLLALDALPAGWRVSRRL